MGDIKPWVLATLEQNMTLDTAKRAKTMRQTGRQTDTGSSQLQSVDRRFLY